MMQYLGANLILVMPIIIGVLNLLTPFISKEDSTERSFFMLTVSVLFLLNVLVLDYLFLYGYAFRFNFFAIGIYSVDFGTEGLGLVFLSMMAVLWFCALLYTSQNLIV